MTEADKSAKRAEESLEALEQDATRLRRGVRRIRYLLTLADPDVGRALLGCDALLLRDDLPTTNDRHGADKDILLGCLGCAKLLAIALLAAAIGYYVGCHLLRYDPPPPTTFEADFYPNEMDPDDDGYVTLRCVYCGHIYQQAVHRCQGGD